MVEKPRKVQLADLLVARGECASRSEAEAWILARRVRVDGQPASKPGDRVPSTAAIEVKGKQKYVSRGGSKLEWALAEFQVSVSGKVVLDAGTSVGGFTDCLLQHGAARVHAVDVGFGQIRGKLSADPRVVNRERTNISDLRKQDFDPPLDLCTVDLSYLSLAKALPVLAELFERGPRIIALVKPLFEGVPQDSKSDLAAIRAALQRLRDALRSSGLSIEAVTHSPILGSSGTVELLILVTREPGDHDFDAQAAHALAGASSLLEAAEPGGLEGAPV
jgi:23S rRNA (cytidine1920-2'-O)/16S rRNA (cytidine1409-2'-O)-methyltransferase